jgi:hypothetical protein
MQPQTQANTHPEPGARAHLYALLGYFVLALVVTWPLALHFTETVPGDLIADRDQNLWNLWWAKEAILRPTNPYWTDLLYYPYGAPLYYHTLALPLGVIGFLPQVVLGLPAAYNTVVLVAFTLSGYGAFRLGLLFTRNPLAAWLGGVVYAFNPYTLDALKGQLEVLSVQWLPLYAEAWIRAGRTGSLRWGLLAGLWLALTILTSLYYAAYAVLFTLAHLLHLSWSRLKTARQPSTQSSVLSPEQFRPPHSALGPRTSALVLAFVLSLPLLWGLVAYRGDPRIESVPERSQRLAYSADLLGYFLPPHDHPFVSAPEKPGVNPPPLHTHLSLGYFALGLAVLGVWAARRKGDLFWAALGGVALLLALGPELQVAGVGTGVPMPYLLIEWLPGWDGIAKIERLVVLARLCMGVLAGVGAAWLLPRIAARLPIVYGRALPFAVLVALLLVELPIHARYTEPLGIPLGFRELVREEERGALMELPFATRQAETGGRRMLGQTAHGRPIMGGYLARSYGSPIADTCSPFWGFISARYLDPSRPDIVSPQLIARPLDVLRFYGISHLAVYPTYGGPAGAPLDPEERDAFVRIATQVGGKPFYTHPAVTLYRVSAGSPEQREPALLMGNNWHDPEDSGGEPFRWMRESVARLCVFAPEPVQASLIMEGTSFGVERDVTIEVAGQEVYTGTFSVGGAFTPVATLPIRWQPGMTEITIRTPKPPVTPRSLDPPSPDTRPLSLGFREVRLESGAPK